MKVTIITFGTFCDIKLSHIIADYFSKKNNVNVVFISNKFYKEIQTNENIEYFYFDYVNKYIDFSSQNETTTENIGIGRIIKLAPLVAYIKTTLKKNTKKYFQDTDYVLVHYPALFLNEIFDFSKKIGVFFVAPSYPNIRIPYIFSKEIKNFDFKDYNGSKGDKIYKSSIKDSITQSLSTGNISKIINLLEKSDIFTMWDPIIFNPPSTIKKMYTLSNIVDTSKEKINNKTTDLVLEEFIKKGKLVYFSLGTMTNIGKKIETIYLVINELIKLDYNVIYQGTLQVSKGPLLESILNSGKLLMYSNFIQHEWIIPKVDLIVTSGSYCITSIANYNNKYLIHIPVIYEQIMWAKAYSYNTSTEFIDLDSIYTPEKIKDIILGCTSYTNFYLNRYLYNLSSNINNANSVEKLFDIIKENVI